VHSLSAISFRLEPIGKEVRTSLATARLSNAGVDEFAVAASAATCRRGGGSNELMKFLRMRV
jgi:hypothetical protein